MGVHAQHVGAAGDGGARTPGATAEQLPTRTHAVYADIEDLRGDETVYNALVGVLGTVHKGLGL